MRRRLARGVWIAGAPARHTLIALIWVYRVSVGSLLGGQCRFYPSCSAYAERAIRQQGAVRGVALAVWRVARCSPLSKGGVDYPPQRRRAGLEAVYDSDIHSQLGRPLGPWEEAAT